MSVTAFTFIREDSKRLPKKSIKYLEGIPLFEYSFKKFGNSNYIDRCIAYTNSSFVKEYTTKHINCNVEVMNRDTRLDADVTFNDIMKSVIDVIETEYVLYFCVTSPFIKKETIDEIIQKVLESNKYDSAFTAKEIKNFCWFNNQPLNYSLNEKIPFTQNLEPIIVESSGFYLFKKSQFKKSKRRIGKHPYIKTIDAIQSHDIDYEEDFVLAENFIRSGLVDAV